VGLIPWKNLSESLSLEKGEHVIHWWKFKVNLQKLSVEINIRTFTSN